MPYLGYPARTVCLCCLQRQADDLQQTASKAINFNNWRVWDADHCIIAWGQLTETAYHLTSSHE